VKLTQEPPLPSARRKKKLIVIALEIVALGCCVMVAWPYVDAYMKEQRKQQMVTRRSWSRW